LEKAYIKVGCCYQPLLVSQNNRHCSFVRRSTEDSLVLSPSTYFTDRQLDRISTIKTVTLWVETNMLSAITNSGVENKINRLHHKQ